MTIAEQFIEWGRKEGRTEGRKEGRTEGIQKILLKQLQARFGALPEAVVTRVHAAGPAELDLWAERILTAPTLDEALGGA